MSTISVEAVTRNAILGEGPYWDCDERVLYYVNVLDNEVRKYDPATKRETFAKIDIGTVSFIVPVRGQKNKYLISAGLNICLLTWDGESEKPADVEILATVGGAGAKEHRLNDGKADASGRFWTGTMGKFPGLEAIELNTGSIYSFSKTKSVTKHVSEISLSNGFAWTHDNKTMFYIDSATKKVEGFDFNLDSGAISNRRTIFDLKTNNVAGLPDGMTVDTDENLWVACFGGSQVIKIDPEQGKLLQTIPLPSPYITSVAFGGSNLDELYITSGTMFLSPEEKVKYPTAGCTYLVKGVNAKGLPMYTVKL